MSVEQSVECELAGATEAKRLKAKLSLSLTEHSAMKAYGRVDA
jgi:hypothetical protein